MPLLRLWAIFILFRFSCRYNIILLNSNNTNNTNINNKPDKEETARSFFEETAINITTEGQKHLGAMLGSRS